MPSAAESAVPAWPAPKLSCSLSLRSMNPFRPWYWRIVLMSPGRPSGVNILWTYT